MEALFHATLTSSTIILLAALGGLFTSLTGNLNIGLEGLMLLSAFLTPFFSQLFSSVLLGVIFGMILCGALATLMYFLHQKFKADIFVVGLAMNLFAAGLTSFLSAVLMGTKGTATFTLQQTVEVFDIPVLSQIPILGYLFQSQNIFDYLSFIAVIIIFILIKKTYFGLNLQAMGYNKRTAESTGLKVKELGYVSFALSGILCALSGAAMSLPLKSFVDGMSNGRGWMALVAVIVGRNNPLGILFAALLLGFASSTANVLQINTVLPPKLLMTIPFIVTLIALCFNSARAKK
jgi:simple sugar transport system permease protein